MCSILKQNVLVFIVWYDNIYYCAYTKIFSFINTINGCNDVYLLLSILCGYTIKFLIYWFENYRVEYAVFATICNNSYLNMLVINIPKNVALFFATKRNKKTPRKVYEAHALILLLFYQRLSAGRVFLVLLPLPFGRLRCCGCLGALGSAAALFILPGYG